MNPALTDIGGGFVIVKAVFAVIGLAVGFFTGLILALGREDPDPQESPSVVNKP